MQNIPGRPPAADNRPPDPAFPSPRDRRSRGWPLRHMVGHLERRMVAGLLVFLPILVTYFIFRFFYDIVASLLDPFINWLNIPYKENAFDWADVVEIAVILVIIYVAGVLIGWAVTKFIINRAHDLIGRIPVIGAVYNTTRMGIDFLSDTQQQSYRGVVLLEFPRLGVWSIGLITSSLGNLDGVEEYLSIYVPTTPVPSSGYLCIAPASKVTPTSITVEEAMRTIISGGILAGDVFAGRVALNGAESPTAELHWLWGIDRAAIIAPPRPTYYPEPIPATTEIQD